MTATKSTPKASEALGKVQALLSSDDLPEAVAITTIQRQGGHVPSDLWSFRNQLLMLLADTHDARGYRQWGKVGRQVRKGAKSFPILAPITRKIPADEYEGYLTAAEEAQGYKVICVGFKDIPVFRYEDTEGDELDLPDYTPVELPPLYERAKELGSNVEYVPGLPGAHGSYNPKTHQITLASQDVIVFFHELAHAAHHQALGSLNDTPQAEREIVAETVAATLCFMFGYSGYERQSKEYIEGYGSKDISKLLSEIRIVLDVILAGKQGGK